LVLQGTRLPLAYLDEIALFRRDCTAVRGLRAKYTSEALTIDVAVLVNSISQIKIRRPTLMTDHSNISFRNARSADAEAVFNITKASISGLAAASYSRDQIENWMGERTIAFYEELIAKGRMTVCVRDDVVVGFVDAEPGEVTRLFIMPDAAGLGLGRRLLEIGVEQARLDHSGPIRLEATINAEAFYQKYGFRSMRRGYFSHGLGGEPIEIVHMEL
jgi:ribosomal protein S18 acetylase RimI-like enzyme